MALTASLLLMATCRLIAGSVGKKSWRWSLFSGLSEATHGSALWMDGKHAHVSFTATGFVHLIYPQTKPMTEESQDLLSQMGFSTLS